MNNQVLHALRRITNKLDSDFSSLYRALATIDTKSMVEQLHEVNAVLPRMGRKYSDLLLVGIDAETSSIMTVNRYTNELQYRNQMTFAVNETTSLSDLPMHHSYYVNELLRTHTALVA